MMYCYTNLTYKSGRNEDALAVMNTFEDSKTLPFYFLHFKKGQLRMRKLDPGAEEDFRFYVSRFRGFNYVKSAYQKLAWLALLKGDTAGYQSYLDSCLFRGGTLVDEDKDALEEARSREIPNVVLLRARLLFDGGYYKEAQREMTKIGSPSALRFRDKLEYTYRYGRIYHKTGKIERAIFNYKATIQVGEKSAYYFAANSALMLGVLYEEQKEYDNAASYFRLCLAMRHHDYQNSIDQKAQAGLERLEKR